MGSRDDAAPFLWGAATSSHQVEGDNVHNDWWAWEQAGRTEGGPSGHACDHWHRFREDLRLAKSLGLTSYRFSVEWSRIEPSEGQWDDAALDWYVELVAECERQGLEPMLTLHHFTSPLWFSKRGGFTAPDAHEIFGRFVERVAKRLAPRVRLWCTINEPLVLLTGTYFAGFMPPGTISARLCVLAYRGLVRSHARAYSVLHRIGGTKVSVGFAHNMIDFMPWRQGSLRDRIATALVSRVYNRAWLDAVDTDFIGVNYYTKGYVRFGHDYSAEYRTNTLPLSVALSQPGETASDLGWAVHAEGLARVLRVASRYGKPIYITENGIADCDDDLRPLYLRSHLETLMRARRQYIDVRGYYHWSLLDNFEWHKGFGPRFGLFHVNYETFERTPTYSARLYSQLITQFNSEAGNSS